MVAALLAVGSCQLQAGKHDRAINLLVKHGWWDRLLSLMRTLDAHREAQPLRAAVAAFKQAGGSRPGMPCCGVLPGAV